MIRSQLSKTGLTYLLLPSTAIALALLVRIDTPSACACGNVGKAFVGSAMRSQQAYLLEHHSLPPSIEALRLGFPADLKTYQFAVRVTETAVFNSAIPKADRLYNTLSIGSFTILKFESDLELKSFISAVFVQKNNPGSSKTILCQADVAGIIQPGTPILRDGIPTCAPGTHPL
jgi:type IV pilus assembly protein PilA